MSESAGPQRAAQPLPPVPPYTAPGYPAPPVYAAPSGYAAPRTYAPPSGGYGPWTPQPAPQTVPARGSGLGLAAVLVAIVATVGAPIAGAVAAFRIGLGIDQRITETPVASDFDWSVLTPVREWVLLGEVAFWAGTVLGIWAIVQGSIAIGRNRGRGWAIAAVVIAVIGPFVFGFAVWTFIFAGYASGASIG